ncbi:hypothetical protein CJ030_MR6G013311 [Morella rubra]|uniref:Uncharacterized protein n=1 Tax=Morella rubra TaxID=262757 RepID=A0A6A1VFA9_9ROSI|nr:hypothetical protein CJ030_MR6G013311 [Morella rubra]
MSPLNFESCSQVNYLPMGYDLREPKGRYTNERTIVDIVGKFWRSNQHGRTALYNPSNGQRATLLYPLLKLDEALNFVPKTFPERSPVFLSSYEDVEEIKGKQQHIN